MDCVPRGGGGWRPSYRFIFSDARLQLSTSPFLQSLLCIRSSMRRSIIQGQPQLIEEFERQPLIWSQWVRDAAGRQLGERAYIEWAAWDMGHAASLSQWLSSQCMDAQVISQHFGIVEMWPSTGLGLR